MTAIFGPWRVHTALSNIEHVELSGPYHFIKAAGPACLAIDLRTWVRDATGMRHNHRQK